MSLADDINNLPEPPNPDEPTPKVEWEGTSGTIQTGFKDASFNPRDYGAVAQEFGEDPATTTMELVGGTKYLQSRRVASRKVIDPETGLDMWVRDFEDKWLYAYRYKFSRDAFVVNLPALYAEVAQTRHEPVDQQPGEATVVVCWADVQTGKVDELGGLKELLERLDEKRAALDDYLQRNAFDRIVIADCGDLIEGYSNFPAQHRTNCLSIMDQIEVAAVEMWKTIRLCAARAPVDVLSIPSNHCAWRKEGKSLAGKVSDDWGLHISKTLERRNEDAQLPVTFHRSGEWEETLQFDIRGTTLGLAHGHQVSNPDQIKNWWAKMTHAGVLDCDILLTGHFHFASLRPSGKNGRTGAARWHIQAPTLDNGSSWVRNKYGEDGDPALAVFQINDDGFDVTSFALL